MAWNIQAHLKKKAAVGITIQQPATLSRIMEFNFSPGHSNLITEGGRRPTWSQGPAIPIYINNRNKVFAALCIATETVYLIQILFHPQSLHYLCSCWSIHGGLKLAWLVVKRNRIVCILAPIGVITGIRKEMLQFLAFQRIFLFT